MKKYRSIITCVLVALVVSGTSCKKEFFTDANINPNSPANVIPSAKLSSVEAALAYTQGGDLSRYSSLFTQQTIGFSRQAEAYYQYILTSQDADNLWGNLYTSVMSNCLDLMKQSDENKYNEYAGISRVLMAYTLQITVDAWGNIPYTEAFKGVDNLQPKFDSDISVYAAIDAMLDRAITELEDANPGVLVPEGDDFIFGGDASRWIKMAHALKARIAIHQSKGNSAKAAIALTQVNLALSANADNAVFKFVATPTTSNPWYQFNEQRTDIGFSVSTLADSMVSRNDPRYTAMIDSAAEFITGFGLAAYYGGIDGSVEFVTYDEMMLLKAEALVRTGDLTNAQAAFQAGITASMTKLGVGLTDINAYMVAYGTLDTDATIAIAQIANEAWYALYLNPEAWVTWRRTGVPVLSPVRGTSIPRRFFYPQTEYSYNAGNVPASSLFTPKVFWDN